MVGSRVRHIVDKLLGRHFHHLSEDELHLCLAFPSLLGKWSHWGFDIDALVLAATPVKHRTWAIPEGNGRCHFFLQFSWFVT
jgi:hypothetical protein